MLNAMLGPGDQVIPVQAGALVGGRWHTDGPQSERMGPYLRRVVSRAPLAGADEVAAVGGIITAWRDLEVGGLVVNGSSNFRLDHVPFGGVKDSGFGRETPRCMIDDYTVIKTMMLRGVSVWGRA